PDAKKMLIIGLGGGSIPKKVQKEFPDMEIDAVEIDPEVFKVARDYFQVKESKNLRLHAMAGRLFLNRTQNQYDIILLDAYFTDAVPFHLTTQQFFELAQKKLAPNGIIVANLISAVTGPSGKIARAFVRTQRQIFPQVYVFAARRPDNVSLDTIQNVIVIATRDKQRLDIKEIVKRAAAINKGLFPDPIQDIAVAYFDRPVPEDVRILTDDYAPTDDLLNPYRAGSVLVCSRRARPQAAGRAHPGARRCSVSRAQCRLAGRSARADRSCVRLLRAGIRHSPGHSKRFAVARKRAHPVHARAARAA